MSQQGKPADDQQRGALPFRTYGTASLPTCKYGINVPLTKPNMISSILQVSTLRFPAKLGLRSRSVCFLGLYHPPSPSSEVGCPFPVWKGRSRGLPLEERIKSLQQELGGEPVFVMRGAEQWLEIPPPH